MFSQWRSTVENLAHPRSPQDDLKSPHSRQNSAADSPTAPSPLTDTPLAAGLRRTFSQQRSGSPAPSPSSASPGHNGDRPTMKSRLEERLRAAAAAAVYTDTPRVATPTPEKSAKPSTPAVETNLLSPKSVPLPDSPPLSPATEIHAPIPVVPLNLDDTLSEDNFSETTVPLPSSPTRYTHTLSESEYSLHSAATHITSSDTSVDTPDIVAIEQPSSTQAEVTPTDEVSTESLQERLRLVEQRFSDVSKSFKRLQAEKTAADSILRELTPLETVQDAEGLRGYLENSKLKADLSRDEIRRLSEQLERQEARIEELRDTHRLESVSRSEQVDRLQNQLAESESMLKAAQDQTTQAQDRDATTKSEIEHLQKELEKSRTTVKDEEEKRSKAISLLKTVRQKLVKAEKDREDVVRELVTLKDKDKEARQKDAQEKLHLQQEIEAANNERENALRGLRNQYDKDTAALKTRLEKDTTAIKAQLELELVTLNAAHAKEIQFKNAQLATSENTINTLTRDKNEFFDQLQLRQAEIESMRFHTESLESQKTELEYQARELEDRLALANEDLAEARRNGEFDAVRSPSTSTEDVARLISEVEHKYEARLAELRRSITNLEKERSEVEADWHKKLQERVREIEELRAIIDSTARSRMDGEHTVETLKAEIERLRVESDAYRQDAAVSQLQVTQAADDKAIHERAVSQLQSKIGELEKELEEAKAREAQARSSNKTLREELRKVQSSAALLERQRNPGVGHWQTRQDGERRASHEAPPSTASKPQSSSTESEEEVNLEYLRNVILQFLEHKEMRPNLVRVLSIILHFTPQETRRLVAKV